MSDAAEAGPIVFFDGVCALCNRAVDMMLRADRDAVFRFAPLQGETFAAREVEDPPDSVAVATDDGRLLYRSAAVLHLAGRLGGYWRLLGTAARVVPRPVADFLYNRIAAVRHRLFAKPSDVCPMLPPALRARMRP